MVLICKKVVICKPVTELSSEDKFCQILLDFQPSKIVRKYIGLGLGLGLYIYDKDNTRSRTSSLCTFFLVQKTVWLRANMSVELPPTGKARQCGSAMVLTIQGCALQCFILFKALFTYAV